MHIYGVGTSGNMGSGVKHLMDRKYNMSRSKMGGQSFIKNNTEATVNAGVIGARLTLDSNRVSNISRPFVTVDAEVRDIWSEITDSVSHVSFLPENRPKITYEYPLRDSEIIGLVDAGLYSNPRFEALFESLLESEQFEIINDVEYQTVDVIVEGELTPLILVSDVGHIVQGLEDDDDAQYTTFNDAIDNAIDIALQLKAEGISTDALIQSGDKERIAEVEVVIDDEFDTGFFDTRAETVLSEEDELKIINELQESIVETDNEDAEIDISDEIDMTGVFGKTSEEERILELRDARMRGELDTATDDVDLDAFDSQFDDHSDDVDDFGFDDISDDFELVDEMDVEVLLEDEDEDEFEL